MSGTLASINWYVCCGKETPHNKQGSEGLNDREKAFLEDRMDKIFQHLSEQTWFKVPHCKYDEIKGNIRKYIIQALIIFKNKESMNGLLMKPIIQESKVPRTTNVQA